MCNLSESILSWKLALNWSLKLWTGCKVRISQNLIANLHYKHLLVKIIAITFELIDNVTSYFQRKQSFELTVKLINLSTTLALISIGKQITDRVSGNEKVVFTTWIRFLILLPSHFQQMWSEMEHKWSFSLIILSFMYESIIIASVRLGGGHPLHFYKKHKNLYIN